MFCTSVLRLLSVPEGAQRSVPVRLPGSRWCVFLLSLRLVLYLVSNCRTVPALSARNSLDHSYCMCPKLSTLPRDLGMLTCLSKRSFVSILLSVLEKARSKLCSLFLRDSKMIGRRLHCSIQLLRRVLSSLSSLSSFSSSP